MSLATDDFASFCQAVSRLTGLDLSQYKRQQMERRVRTFAERRGEHDLSSYGRRLAADREELDAFLDRVTINVSQLWRNPEQWRVLGRDLLPVLAAGGRLRAWSAGSSYGAEAFTLAAVAHEALPGARVDIKGTDIDRRMVERARRGWFSAEDARDAPADALARWFAPADGGWQAGPELLRSVRFETGDLLKLRPPADHFDLVLCRNTVIYFTDDVRDALHARLARALRPGGVLLVGATERVSAPQEKGLVPVRPFVYRRED
jgi:chemotaxis protein methyltransferase CheR